MPFTIIFESVDRTEVLNVCPENFHWEPSKMPYLLQEEGDYTKVDWGNVGEGKVKMCVICYSVLC